MGRGPGVRATSKSSIQIDFRYRGARCREKLKLPPTPANLAYAKRLKATIEREITLGIFDYATHFPDSPRAVKLARTPGAAITVGEMLTAWLPTIAAEVEPETLKKYDQAIRHTLTPKFGTLRLTELSLRAVKAWAAELVCSRKRLLTILTPLRQALDMAVDEGYLQSNPLAGWKLKHLVAVREEIIDPFTPEEIAAILPHLVEPVANAAQFWVWSGVREGELFALTWADVDLAAGTARITKARRGRRLKAPKTSSSVRTIRLLPPALEALQRQRAHTQLIGREIFLDPRTQEPWIGDKPLRNLWKAACTAAGVRYRYPYQLRHTFASWMLSSGENPLWVAQQMGHSDWSMIVKTYGKWIPAIDPEAGMRAVRMITKAG